MMLTLSPKEKREKMPGQGLRIGASKVWEDEDWPAHPPRKLLQAARNKDWRYWTAGDLQDQGSTPHCVEYSGRGLLECSPARNQTEAIPRGSIYAWCQKNDEWTGENYDGTSVHALMKWLRANGYVSHYEWARSVEEVHAHMMTRGPAVFGTTWYERMSYVDDAGYARIGGANYGGHAWLARGRNRLIKDPVTGVLGRTTIRNSWGDSYGNDGSGEAYINDRDLAALIEDYGEVALAVEVVNKTSSWAS